MSNTCFTVTHCCIVCWSPRSFFHFVRGTVNRPRCDRSICLAHRVTWQTKPKLDTFWQGIFCNGTKFCISNIGIVYDFVRSISGDVTEISMAEAANVFSIQTSGLKTTQEKWAHCSTVPTTFQLQRNISSWLYKCFSLAYIARTVDICVFASTRMLTSFVN